MPQLGYNILIAHSGNEALEVIMVTGITDIETKEIIDRGTSIVLNKSVGRDTYRSTPFRSA